MSSFLPIQGSWPPPVFPSRLGPFRTRTLISFSFSLESLCDRPQQEGRGFGLEGVTQKEQEGVNGSRREMQVPFKELCPVSQGNSPAVGSNPAVGEAMSMHVQMCASEASLLNNNNNTHHLVSTDCGHLTNLHGNAVE